MKVDTNHVQEIVKQSMVIKKINDNKSVGMDCKVGYVKRSPHSTSSRLLRRVRIASYIWEIKSEMVENVFRETIDVRNEKIKIAFANTKKGPVVSNKTFPKMAKSNSYLTLLVYNT
ncbi:terminase small subunit [Bacillus pacificus]|uniref:terminase small subunit n=1 Tax=Bacillus pacificus TaxID=2026187 RepID=UPI003A803CF4